MSGIHTPFLGGTGFGGRADSGADSSLAPPYIPGEEGAGPSEAEEASGRSEPGFAAAAVTVPEREAPEEPALEDEIADWAEDITEEEEAEAVGASASVEADSSVRTAEPEAEEDPVGRGEPEGHEAAEGESEFPDFLFGGDSGEESEAGDLAPAGEDTGSSSPASRLDAETRERIRALARELEGDDAPEDVIARAYEEGYRKAREEEN